MRLIKVNLKNITIDDYANAVAKLAELALTGTSGGRAAAQVILSAYNGNNWQLDVTDLMVLDDDNYELAMAVINGRVQFREEPHLLINNGADVFKEIQKIWVRFHIANRWKSSCYDCEGRGVIYDEDDYDADNPHECKSCKGSGLSDVVRKPPVFD